MTRVERTFDVSRPAADFVKRSDNRVTVSVRSVSEHFAALPAGYQQMGDMLCMVAGAFEDYRLTRFLAHTTAGFSSLCVASLIPVSQLVRIVVLTRDDHAGKPEEQFDSY